jgi:L-asparaginase
MQDALPVCILKGVFMKPTLIINTGGTFSSVAGQNGLRPGIKANSLAAVLEEGEGEIVLRDAFSLDSANITPAEWTQLAGKIAAERDRVSGVVVIHGTDTMAYTASALSFALCGIDIPVVLTGSQLPLGAPLSDAELNLRLAVQMARSGAAGVFVAFDRRVMLGCRTAKVRTLSFNAFETINHPLVAKSDARGLRLDPAALPEFAGPFSLKPDFDDRIAVIQAFPGMKAQLLSALIDNGARGIFIEAFGLGGLPFKENALPDGIQAATEADIPVLVGSQCRYEGADLDIYETGRRVQEAGGIPVYDMTQEAVVTKLMWALGQTYGRAGVRDLFGRSFCGEVTKNV